MWERAGGTGQYGNEEGERGEHGNKEGVRMGAMKGKRE